MQWLYAQCQELEMPMTVFVNAVVEQAVRQRGPVMGVEDEIKVVLPRILVLLDVSGFLTIAHTRRVSQSISRYSPVHLGWPKLDDQHLSW
jgi:hypothetical protein